MRVPGGPARGLMTEAVNGATYSKSDTSTKSAPFAETCTLNEATVEGGAAHCNVVEVTEAMEVWPPKRHSHVSDGGNEPRIVMEQPPVAGHCWGATLSTSIVAW
jgi:hypothetical protein